MLVITRSGCRRIWFRADLAIPLATRHQIKTISELAQFFVLTREQLGHGERRICRGPSTFSGLEMRKSAAIIARPAGVKIGECS
jgi:hypothetical protein